MDIAYQQILVLLLQCTIIAVLLLSLFRFRNIFGLSVLIITLGVFQFIQVFLTSTLSIEIYPGYDVSPGSMVLFTGSLFAILLVYLRENAIKARKLIYAIFIANGVIGLLLVIFSFLINDVFINNVYNLPVEFYSQNVKIIFVGTTLLLLDGFLIVLFYEFISKYVDGLFFRILITMVFVLSLDSILFSAGVFAGTEKFEPLLVSGVLSKSLASVVYSILFTLYLVYIDKPEVIKNENESFKDLFRTLTFREKYEDVLEKMKIKTEELQETQDIAQLGSYILDLKTNAFSSSPIFNKITGLNNSDQKFHEYYSTILHPDDRELNEKFYIESIRTRKPFNRKYRIFRNNKKEIRWLHERGRVILKNGEPVQFKGTVQDITDQKFNEFALKKQNEELNILSKELSIKNELVLESERKFKNLFDKSPISLWEEDFSIVKRLLDEKKSTVKDLEKYLNDNPDFVKKCIANVKILNVNDVTLQLLGVSNKEELIDQLGQTFNLKSYQTFKKELLALNEDKKEFTGETEFTRSDGKIVHALIKYVVLNDDFSKAIISIVDITELNEIKEEIQKSEKQFRELFEKSGDAILIIENQIFTECNQATIKMLEYKTKEEFLNVHPSELSPPTQPDGRDSFEKAVEMMEVALKNGTHRFEWIHTKKSGKNFPVEVLLTAITNAPDKKTIHCVWRDISDRKMAETTLIESERALRNAQEIASLGSFNLDFKTELINSSKIFDKIVGYKPDDIKSLETWRKIVHPEDLENNKKLLENCILNKEIFNHEYRIIHKETKEIRWLHGLGEIIYEKGEPQNFRGTIQDITHRKINEITIKRNEQKLLEVQKIANLGTYEIDLKTNIVKTSEIYKSILGIKETPKNNKGWWKSITHPDDYERSELLWHESLQNCKPYEDEYRVLTGTKQLKWIYDLAEVKCDNGIATKVVGTIQDITVRKLAEITSKNNEIKLNEAQRISRLGSFIFYDETNSFESNSIFDEIVGINSDYTKDLNGWLTLIYPEDFNEVHELLNNASLTSIGKEFRISRFNDKEVVWVKGLAKIFYDQDGNRIKVVGTLQDITERKLAELKIKRSDTILSQINSLVKVMDKKGHISYASPSFKTILGFEPEEMLGQGWWIKTTPNIETANRIRDAVLDTVLKNEPIADILKDRWVKAEDGSLKIFDWVCSEGEHDTLIFIGIDVTDRKLAEKNIIEYWNIVEDSLNEIYIFEADTFHFIQVNKGARENIGYSFKELKKMTPIDLKPEFTKSLFKKLINPLNTGTKDRIIFNTPHKRKDGTLYTAEIHLQKSEINQQPVFIAFVKDITIQQHDERIKQVIFNITKKSGEIINLREFFFFIKNELGRLINTDNFFIALYDEKTDMISTPYMVDELDDASDFPKGETLTGHVIDTKKALLTSEKFVSYTSEGKRIIGLGPESKCWLGVPLLIENKAIGAIVVQSYKDSNAYSEADVGIVELIASNIAYLIQKTKDLEKIRLLNQALIQSPHAVIVTNLQGEIEFTNPAFEKLTGYTLDEVLGMKPNILRENYLKEEEYKSLWKILRKGNSWEGEFINQTKNGKSYLVEVNISAVKNIENQITHYILVQEDVTIKRKLERQFINAFIEAQEVEKQNFGEELHDGISQILSAESMYIDLLIEQNQDRIKDKAKFLTKIKELNLSAVNETRNIAHGLMSSQLKQSGLLIAAENICIDFNSVKSVKFSFQNKGVKEEEISKEIKTNLFRIIQELTTNINRYSSATKASVEFRKINDSTLKLMVTDNGIGMNYNKIKQERKVTGLQNVERRITFLNGTFEVFSKPNKGTRWEITVPL